MDITVKKIDLVVKRAIYPYFQALLSSTISSLAKIRMKVITDSGTLIGLRRKLFDEVIPKKGIGVELGVYKGTLSQYILNVSKPSCLHLVDPWWYYESHWHWADGDTSTVRSFASILLVLQEEISTGKVKFHIGGSKEVLESFEDSYLDWAYIDSTHAYAQTKEELSLLKYKVKPTGIIGGDDWREDPSHKHHGVYKAVNEFLSHETEYKLIFQEGTQWALTRKVS